jgi:hypothetical protein
MRARVLAAMISCGFLLSCGGGTSNSGQTVNGNWQFSGTSTVFFGNTTGGTATLTQNGSSVSGTVSLTGTPCATSGSLSGTVSGSTFNFTIQEGSQSVSFMGQLNSVFTEATGTYTAPAGGCTNGDQGNWTATKMQ